MNKIYILIIFFLVTNCSLNPVVKHHGVHFLDKKQEKLKIKSTNKNDIINILGPPSAQSVFDNDIWIYIERKTSKSSVVKLGKKTLITNNVLILEVDTKGLLVKKDFYDMDKMNKINFSEKITENKYSKNSYVYDFLSSMRQKIDDPLGKRKR